MISDAMIPVGISFWGFLASSEAVETASNPMYEKKMIAAPAPIPFIPLGEKDGVVHCVVWTKLTPTAMNSRMIPILIETISVLTHAVSVVPMTRSQVTTMTISAAGRLNTTGM